MRRRMEAGVRHAQPAQAVAALQDLSTGASQPGRSESGGSSISITQHHAAIMGSEFPRQPVQAGAKPPGAALAEDCRGERSGRRRGVIASGGDQEDVPEPLRRMTGGACAVEASKETETASKPGALGNPPG